SSSKGFAIQIPAFCPSGCGSMSASPRANLGRAAGMHWEMSGGSCTCQRPGLGITSTSRTVGDGLAPKHTAGEQLTGVHTSEPSKPNARLTAAQPLYREWRASVQSTRGRRSRRGETSRIDSPIFAIRPGLVTVSGADIYRSAEVNRAGLKPLDGPIGTHPLVLIGRMPGHQHLNPHSVGVAAALAWVINAADPRFR